MHRRLSRAAVQLHPADTVPADTVPTDTVPTDTVPTDTVPADTVPADTVPAVRRENETVVMFPVVYVCSD